MGGKHAVTAVIDTVEGCIDFCSRRDGAGAAVYHAKDATVNKRQCSCRRAKPCGADRRAFGIAHESHRSHMMGQTGGVYIFEPEWGAAHPVPVVKSNVGLKMSKMKGHDGL